MAYRSNPLTHWVGKGNSEEEQYRILTQLILKPKKLLFGKPESHSLSPYLPEGSSPKDVLFEIISFTDISLSECEPHCKKYSKFGISFDKAYLTSLHATPVWYFQNPAAAGNLYYIVKTLYKLAQIVKEKTGKEEFDFNNNEKDHTVEKNTLPLLKYIFSYVKPYDEKNSFPYNSSHLEQDKFFKTTNEKAEYFEREWRIIPSTLAKINHPNSISEENGHKYLNFDENYVQYVIMPKKFIARFKIENKDVSSKHDINYAPTLLAYEDLKYMHRKQAARFWHNLFLNIFNLFQNNR